MKKQVISTELKKRCKTCDAQALRESLSIMINNQICNLAAGKEEDYKRTQGHLKALEEVLSLISTP